jgi:hypothetical protein
MDRLSENPNAHYNCVRFCGVANNPSRYETCIQNCVLRQQTNMSQGHLDVIKEVKCIDINDVLNSNMEK